MNVSDAVKSRYTCHQKHLDRSLIWVICRKALCGLLWNMAWILQWR